METDISGAERAPSARYDSRSSKGERVSRHSMELAYPMFVVPFQRLLSMQVVVKHEDLLAECALIPYEELSEDTPRIFVTHTWLALDHPDPDSHQLRLLQGFIEVGLRGGLRVEPHWFQMYVSGLKAKAILGKELQPEFIKGTAWIDFSCVPQNDPDLQRLAISSLTCYVESCSLIVCISPPVKHTDGSLRDVRGWRSRGWCRLEALANNLSATQKKLILVESLTKVQSAVASDWLEFPVGLGRFAVESDKHVLAGVMKKMVHRRTEQAGAESDKSTFRALKALENTFFAGMERELPDDSESLDAWLSKMKFATPCEEESTGLSPLRFAVTEGRMDIVSTLISHSVNLEAPLIRRSRWLSMIKGCTILFSAAYYRSCPDLVQLLLSSGAKPGVQAALGFTAAHAAAMRGFAENVAAMLEFDADALQVRAGIGIGVHTTCLFKDHGVAFEQLMDLHPDPAMLDPDFCTPTGASIFVTLAMSEATTKTLQMALRRGYNINCPGRPHWFWRGIYGAYEFQARWNAPRSCGFFCDFAANIVGATPVATAAMMGDVLALEFCLENGADINISNAHGRSPMMLAALFGHVEIVKILARAGASLDTIDAWGFSSLDWAESRQHSAVAAFLRELTPASKSTQSHGVCCGRQAPVEVEELQAADAQRMQIGQIGEPVPPETWLAI